MERKTFEIDHVYVPSARRKTLDPASVEALAASAQKSLASHHTGSGKLTSMLSASG